MNWVVTGGAGFVGTNLVASLVEAGQEVLVIDDLSREGTEHNAAFLKERFDIEPAPIDVSDQNALNAFLDASGEIGAIAHLAGQVSLLESIRHPRRDFEINAIGTLNVLEWVRSRSIGTAVIGMSSNKVYGDLDGVKTEEQATRYVVPDWPNGFDESLPLEFHGPYGCSKGVADQYLGDYARTYGMKTASLRQSSVYGPHQHPRSDQGWVAHLVGEAVRGRQIQLNGIGKQVRDLLHARDLARLFVLLAEKIEPYGVNQVNVGGGPENALSILELFEWLASNGGVQVDYLTGDERPSDQKVFVSDNRKVEGLTGWSPEISLDEGLLELLEAARGA